MSMTGSSERLTPERLNGHPDGQALPDRELVALSDELGRARFAPRASKYDAEAAFPAEDYDDLIAHRLTTMNVPAEYGGLGVHPLTYALVLKNIARGNASTGLTLNMHSTLCFFVERMGTEEQKRRLFGEVVSGKLLASASSEPAASFRGTFTVDATAEPVEGGYRVNALKHFCSLSGAAGYYMTWTALPGATLSEGTIYLAIPAKTPGVEIVPNWDTVALRSTDSNSVRFKDVLVPSENRIGAPGELVRENIIDRFSLGYSAVYLGVAEAAYEFAHEYAATKSFAPDPLPISHRGDVQAKIAEMDVLLEAADGLLRRAALAVAEGDEGERTLALNRAKYFIGEAAPRVTDLAFKLVGARAIFRQYPLERHMRDAKAAALMPPSGDRCLETLGKTLFGLSAATLEA